MGKRKEEARLVLKDLLRWLKDKHTERKDLIDDIEKHLNK